MQSSSAGDSKPSGDNEARLTAKLKRVLSAPTQVVKLPRTHRPGEQVEPAKAAKQEESSHRIPYANPDAKAVRWVTNSSVAEFEERREESASPLSPMERAVYHPTSDSFLSPDRDELQALAAHQRKPAAPFHPLRPFSPSKTATATAVLLTPPESPAGPIQADISIQDLDDPQASVGGIRVPVSLVSSGSHKPGQVSKPIRAWTRSGSLTFAFYEWPPFAPRFRFFSKRSGGLYRAEIEVLASDLQMPTAFTPAPHQAGEAEHNGARYLEYTLLGLRPNARYSIRVTSVGGTAGPQTDKGYMTTLSHEEQYKRDTVMSRFVGVVAVINGRDCQVSKFDAETGLFTVRLMDAEEVPAPLLIRFRSEYTDQGHGAQCYTVSTVFFTRWGGEMRSSSTLSAREMQDKARQAADSRAATRAEREYDLRAQLMRREMRDLKHRMADEQKAWEEERKILTRVFLGALLIVAILAAVALAWLWLDGKAALRRQEAIVSSLSLQLTSERQSASNSSLVPLNLTPDAHAALGFNDAKAQEQHAKAFNSSGSLFGGSKPAPPITSASHAGRPNAGDTAEDSKPEHHVPLGDQLEQHLRTLTDLYQNQVLLQMQKAMSKAGIIHRDESGSRNRL